LFSSLTRTRRLVLFVALVLMVPLLAACTGNGDDDATSTPDVPAAATTPDTGTTPDVDGTPDDAEGTPDMGTTPDAASTPDMDTTPDTDMTPDTTGTPDMDTTPDTDVTPDTTGTPDTAATPDTTPDTATTPDAMTTPGTGVTDSPFGDLDDLAADVPNFTLEFTGEFVNVPDDAGDTTSSEFELMLAQSDPDVYHLRIVTTGDEEVQVELWSLPTATYLSEDGSDPIQLPAGLAGEFSLAEVLMVMPPVELVQNAEEVGEDEINGRTATEYRVSAQEAVMILLAQGQDITVSNPQGEMTIWVDEELGIILQMDADITFDNDDGTEGSILIEYVVTDIGDTDDIEAPTNS
jgi:hypothetical protein